MEKLRIQYQLIKYGEDHTELIAWPKNGYKCDSEFKKIAHQYLSEKYGAFHSLQSAKMYNETKKQQS